MVSGDISEEKYNDALYRLDVNRKAVEILQARKLSLQGEVAELKARIAELEAKYEPDSKDAGGNAE